MLERREREGEREIEHAFDFGREKYSFKIINYKKRLKINSSIILGACSRGLPCCKLLLGISHSTVTDMHCVSPWKQHVNIELLEGGRGRRRGRLEI